MICSPTYRARWRLVYGRLFLTRGFRPGDVWATLENYWPVVKLFSFIFVRCWQFGLSCASHAGWRFGSCLLLQLGELRRWLLWFRMSARFTDFATLSG